MTSKEAIDELNTIKVVYSNMRKEYLTCVEALDMAIEALETQERQAIIAGSYLLEGEENVPDTNVGDIECGEKIERSSAQPDRPEQPESAREYCAECDHIEMCRWYPYEGCEFRSLPPAQPNTIPMEWIQMYADDWQDMNYAYDNPILGMLEDWMREQDEQENNIS